MFFIFFFICCYCLVEKELNALRDFYVNLNGDRWYTNTNWNVGDPCDNKWFGVVCNDENNHVEQLVFVNNNLDGKLVESIGDFEELNVINFNGNGINGHLPKSFTKLRNLYAIGMTNNNFSGNLPKEFGKLSEIRYLHMDFNSFEGEIPESMYDCVYLDYFGLYSNKLTGKISSSINKLINLKTLYLSNNNFYGRFPDLKNLEKLETIGLSGNKFSGDLPELINLPRLQELELAINQFESTIPSSYSQLTDLLFFILHTNRLDGVIPDSLSNLKSMMFCDLHENLFTGYLPSFFEYLSEYKVDLSNIPFKCPIPNWAKYTKATCVKNDNDDPMNNDKIIETDYELLDEKRLLNVDKVQVQIFGMSKCQDTASIEDIFYNISKREGLLDIMDVRIDYIGDVKETLPTGIYSMHGQVEALGSLFQMCVHDNYPFPVYMEFLYCLNENQSLIPLNVEECSKKLSINYDTLLQCSLDDGTRNKLQESVILSHKYQSIWSPTIFINNKLYCLWHSSPCDASKPIDFLTKICSTYQGKKPIGCL